MILQPPGPGFSNGMGNFGGPGPRGGMDIPVPRSAVGIVIGKGGEMIKKIQAETGAKVQFKQDDGQSEDRFCSLTGPPDKVQAANDMIQDLLNNAGVCFCYCVVNFAKCRCNN